MIPVQTYAMRRKQLAAQLGQEALAVLSATKEQLRNGDAAFRFRQNSDFYYLTGFNEPDAVLIILGGSGESILFNRPKDPEHEQWTGKRLGQEEAIETLQVQQAYSIHQLGQLLPQLCKDKKSIYYVMGQDAHTEAFLLKTIAQLKIQAKRELPRPVQLCDLEPYLSEMRLFKDAEELGLMQKSADISVLAHQRAMQVSSKCSHEYQLEAELVRTFIEEGCRGMAYEPIVAAGKNACILHYGDNNALIPKDALILIDAAGEYESYAADITRTFPAKGKFSPEQRSLYELVLKAQQAAIAKIKPGLLWSEIQDTILQILVQGLSDLGLLKGSLSTLIETQAYKRFYMHSSGHWLGLDVHDSGHYKQDNASRPLAPNMALTVEPGLYIPEAEDIDKRWWNIGIRIEDDILVTSTGFKNLTAALPVQVDEIEALVCG